MATADEQAQRNRKILLARVAGQSVAEIAQEHNLSQVRVRQVLASGVRVLGEDRDDPVQLALELRGEFELVLEEAKLLVTNIPSNNPAAKIGALKLVLVALERLTEWHLYTGVLPRASIAPEIDFREVTSKLMRVFEEFELGPEIMSTVSRVLRSDNDEIDLLPPRP